MAESNSASNVNSSDVCDSAIASCHNEKEYEAQFFGFTPKSFVDGGMLMLIIIILAI